MNFRDVRDEFEWIPYDGQSDSNVTYLWVRDLPITRLVGESDILYIGKTEQGKTDPTIRSRFVAETNTNNSRKNTQQTNIRATHIFKRLGLENCKLYFTKQLKTDLLEPEKTDLLEKIRTWHKTLYV